MVTNIPVHLPRCMVVPDIRPLLISGIGAGYLWMQPQTSNILSLDNNRATLSNIQPNHPRYNQQELLMFSPG